MSSLIHEVMLPWRESIQNLRVKKKNEMNICLMSMSKTLAVCARPARRERQQTTKLLSLHACQSELKCRLDGDGVRCRFIRMQTANNIRLRANINFDNDKLVCARASVNELEPPGFGGRQTSLSCSARVSTDKDDSSRR